MKAYQRLSLVSFSLPLSNLVPASAYSQGLSVPENCREKFQIVEILLLKLYFMYTYVVVHGSYILREAYLQRKRANSIVEQN